MRTLLLKRQFYNLPKLLRVVWNKTSVSNDFRNGDNGVALNN